MVRFSKLHVLAIALTLVSPANADGDLKIKQQVTLTITSFGESRSSQHEETIYVQGARQRREFRIPDVGETHQPHTAEIWDCQTLLGYHMDLNTRRFAEARAITYPTKERVHALTQQEEKRTKQSYSVQAIDTGEREPIFGLMARHIVTSIHGVTAQDWSEAMVDGWYVDMPEPGCAPEYLRQGEATEVHVTFLSTKHSKTVYTGFVPPGFAVEQTITTRSRFEQKDLQREIVVVEHRKVVEFSRETLDPALFSAPAGFEKVDRLPWNVNLPKPVLRQR